MRYLLLYILVIIIFLFGCKNETPSNNEIRPNKENLTSIISSQDYKLTIKCCHGGIVGKVSCHDELISFKNDTLEYYNGDETYIKRIDKSKQDYLNSYYYRLLDFHRPEKKIEKDGFGGCMYHDYNFTFENDSLEITIKPQEGNGIFYKILELININYYYEYISGHVDGMSIDSSDLDVIINHNIVTIKKLVHLNSGIETLGGLNLELSNDTSSISLSILPTPNPGISSKRLSPYLKFQRTNDFSEFEIMPERQIQPLNSSDTLLNNIVGQDILGIEFDFKPRDESINKLINDIYGVNSKDTFVMKICFKNKKRVTIENNGFSLDIYE